MTILLYPLLTAAAYYLLVQATITKWLWSKYPPRLEKFLLCSACSGFWYGLGVACAIGWTQNLSFLGFDGRFWLTPILVGLCSVVWTPILAGAQINALNNLSSGDLTSSEREGDL